MPIDIPYPSIRSVRDARVRARVKRVFVGVAAVLKNAATLNGTESDQEVEDIIADAQHRLQALQNFLDGEGN